MTTGPDGAPGGKNPPRRTAIVTGLFDFSTGHGLEVGPLHRPLLTRDVADVSYVDVYPRAKLIEVHAHSPRVRGEDIPEIDFPLWDGERVRTIDEATKAGAPFDWIYASHVVEHVPDLIGWLQQLESISTPDGALVLVVPDRRYCFDAHRPPTTVGEMVLAHDNGDTIPSVRAVYDHHRSAIRSTAPQLWKGKRPGYAARIHPLTYVMRQVERARAGHYVDCHVWTFTDTSFVQQVEELGEMGLTSWWVESVKPAPQNTLEFFAVLRRGPRPPEHRIRRPNRPDWINAPTRRKRPARRKKPAPPPTTMQRVRRRLRRTLRHWRG